MRLGNVSTFIQPSNIPDGTGRFLYFNLNDMPDFVEEGARLIAEHIKALNLEHPFFVTPETSTISLAHVLRTKYNIDGIIISKRKKPNDCQTLCEEYCAYTSLENKTLYLDMSIDLSDKNIVIIDNVCTTGQTLKAVYKLLCNAGVHTDKIAQAIVLFTEGEKLESVKITENIFLPVHAFEHIPILPMDPTIDGTLFKLFSSCDLPTQYGTLQFCVFKHRSLPLEAVALPFSPLTFYDAEKQIFRCVCMTHVLPVKHLQVLNVIAACSLIKRSNILASLVEL